MKFMASFLVMGALIQDTINTELSIILLVLGGLGGQIRHVPV